MKSVRSCKHAIKAYYHLYETKKDKWASSHSQNTFTKKQKKKQLWKGRRKDKTKHIRRQTNEEILLIG